MYVNEYSGCGSIISSSPSVAPVALLLIQYVLVHKNNVLSLLKCYHFQNLFGNARSELRSLKFRFLRSGDLKWD